MPEETTQTQEVLDQQPAETTQEASVSAELETQPVADQEQQQPAAEPSETPAESQRPSKNEQIIEALKRSRDGWREEANKWHQMATAKAGPQEQAKPQVPQQPEKPRQDQFENYDDYLEALADYKAEVKITTRLQQEEERRRAEEERRYYEAQQRSHFEKIAQASQKYPEVQNMISDSYFPVSKNMLHAVMDSEEHSSEILYYLATHKDEAAQIYRLNPVATVRAIGRIERDIEVQKRTTKQPTKAPEPIRPITGTGQASIKPIEDMSVDEYIAYRNKQEFGK